MGATNAGRILGKTWFFIIMVFDILKGFLPVHLAKYFMGQGLLVPSSLLLLAIAFSTILGHLYPVYLNFKGGKGVTVSAGMLMAFDYRLVIGALVIFIIIVFITRYISAGSVVAAVILPVLYALFYKNDIDIVFFIFIILLALYVIYKHKENIKRIIQGKERKWGERV